MDFKIGDFIEFKIDYWDLKGNHSLKLIKKKVQGFIHDPMKVKKSKYIVKYKKEKLGVPFDEVVNIQIQIKFK